MRIVTFYRTASGRCPVEDFLDSLPAKAAQKVTWVLKLLEELETVPAIYFKKLIGTEKIWECRISFCSRAFRILGFFADDDEIVLSNGFVKKTGKTPRSEIEKAEAHRNDYFRRRKLI